jgi:hypothetical protein
MVMWHMYLANGDKGGRGTLWESLFSAAPSHSKTRCETHTYYRPG